MQVTKFCTPKPTVGLIQVKPQILSYNKEREKNNILKGQKDEA
jgi:hypothetical protein